MLKLTAGSNSQTELPVSGLGNSSGVAVDPPSDVYAIDGTNLLYLPETHAGIKARIEPPDDCKIRCPTRASRKPRAGETWRREHWRSLDAYRAPQRQAIGDILTANFEFQARELDRRKALNELADKVIQQQSFIDEGSSESMEAKGGGHCRARPRPGACHWQTDYRRPAMLAGVGRCLHRFRPPAQVEDRPARHAQRRGHKGLPKSPR